MGAVRILKGSLETACEGSGALKVEVRRTVHYQDPFSMGIKSLDGTLPEYRFWYSIFLNKLTVQPIAGDAQSSDPIRAKGRQPSLPPRSGSSSSLATHLHHHRHGESAHLQQFTLSSISSASSSPDPDAHQADLHHAQSRWVETHLAGHAHHQITPHNNHPTTNAILPPISLPVQRHSTLQTASVQGRSLSDPTAIQLQATISVYASNELCPSSMQPISPSSVSSIEL
ncbi:hypothetical protein ACLOJK_022625 [Asimina triloba]